MKICCIIPARNEEATIAEVIQGVRKYISPYDIYVVDNYSDDETLEVAVKEGVVIVPQYGKKGYGASQWRGQESAIKAGYEFILQLDADGQHDPNDIPRLIQAMEDYPYDIVLGSRFAKGIPASISLMRRLGIHFFSMVVSIIAKQRITDVTSGFKIYRVSSLMKLHKPSDINPAIGQMTEIAKKGMKVGEVAVEMRPRKHGNSHLDFKKFVVYPVRAIFNIIKVMVWY